MTVKKLLLPLFAICLILTTSTPALVSNDFEDTTSQVAPLSDLPSLSNPLDD